MNGPVSRHSSGYRQGAVLGLTLAEVMLLLVFCLLLGMGATLTRERAERQAAENREAASETRERKSADLLREVRQDPRVASALAPAAPDRADTPGDLWRRLSSVENLPSPDAGTARTLAETGDGDAGRQARPQAPSMKERPAIQETERAPKPPEASTGLIDRGLAALGLRRGPGDWPPMVNLGEAAGYRFGSGSAQLSDAFANRLSQVVVPRLAEIGAAYDVNVIEVVGHTDERPVSARGSNLDALLPDVASGRLSVSALQPADNAGLGLSRAMAVVAALSADPRLRGYRILPMSGAQMIRTDERLSRGTDDAGRGDRRRIEIRMRRASEHPPT